MLYANTDDGSSALWVCDGSGVVVDNISIYGAERAPILEQINEHYGTSFTGWSDNEMSLRFGDTIPNWNAYEKIFKQTLIAVKISDESVIAHFGYIEKNKFYWAGKNNGTQMQQLNITTGYITGVSNFDQAVENSIYQTIQQRYQNVSEIGPYDSELNIYQKPQNWSEYEIM